MSGLILKIIAVVTMLIDHTGMVLSESGVIMRGSTLYMTIRGIGRLAFPIYVFLLVEGAKHTRNKWKYLLRMGLLALLSEVPANLAKSGNLFYPAEQSVFVTLFLGLLVAYVVQWGFGLVGKKQFLGFIASLAVTGAAALLNEKVLHGEYDAAGIFCIAIFSLYGAPLYNLRFKMMNQEGVLRLLFGGVAIMVLSLMTSEIEYLALFALFPIYYYNGQRGYESKVLQWGFYAAYPLHLLLLGFLRLALKG